MTKNVLLSNAQGNFSVELSPEEARNVVEVQQPRRSATTSRMALASMIGLASGFGFGGGRARRSSYAGEWCVECKAKMPPGKPRKCKACRDSHSQ